MRFCSLGSGSSGNASVVEGSGGITRTRLLVDCGFSLRELKRRLTRAEIEPESLDAIFITHEHGDHIGCALALAQQIQRPVIMSRGTWRAVGRDDFDPSLLRCVRDGEVVALGDLELRPFAVPHDANEPLQLRVSDGSRQLGILTDLGSTPDFVAEALAGVQALLLECNHDEAMLRTGRYPPPLKHRILGSHGHLSNAVAGALLARLQHPGLGIVVAAHLSESNNLPALARQALADAVGASVDDFEVADPRDGLAWREV
jgi:phosphoribosyl 1,2-cyclic phosphodiesterase